MSKGKAWLVTAVIMVLFGMVLYLLYMYNVAAFWSMVGIFGIYGFVSFFFDLGKWMLFQPEEHRRIPQHRPTMAEEDARLWENRGW